MIRAALVAAAGCSASVPITLDGPVAPDAPDSSVATASWRSQVIYLALVDRFRNGDASNDAAGGCFDPSNAKAFHGGDFEGLRQHLDYVRDVGATAVWITPPNKQGDGCGYHGYWIDYTDPSDDALQPGLGTAADLDRLVDDLHGAGMRLVLDMVVNHAASGARIVAQHPSWFHDPATCGSLGSVDIYCPVGHKPDFAQEQPDVAAYLSTFEARIATRYRIDGIRMDTAKHVLPSYFATSFFPAVRAAHPDMFAVAEIFDEGSASVFVPYLDAGFTSALHYPLYRALVNAIGHAGSVDEIADVVADGISHVGADRALDLVLFIDNHDVQRFANEPGGVGEPEIQRRLLLALDLIFTLPGIPQLYYGDELGMFGAGDPDNRHDLPSWATDAAGRAGAHPGIAVAGSDVVFARVQRLSMLRRTVPALADGAYRELWRQNGGVNANVFVFSRGTGAGIQVVAIDNGGSAAVHVPIAGLADGTVLVDALGDGAPTAVTVGGGTLDLALPAKTAAIYQVQP